MEDADTDRLSNFSQRQTWLIIGILLLTIFIRTAYISSSSLPAATDLGHHMYWAKEFSSVGKIVEYSQRDIMVIDGVNMIGPSKNISDFIIGEHLIFSAINLLSGLDFISYFPVVTLSIINLASILATFILALRFFAKHRRVKSLAILTLLLLGPLFAIAPPQAKYVAGGVIGNIIGNLMLPVALYFFFRSLVEKNRTYATLAIFSTMGLFYTHHLTGFVLLFILALAVIFSLVINFRNARSLIADWFRLFVSPSVMLFLLFAGLFVLIIYAPSYLRNSAVTTVIGSVSKAGHEGLTFSAFKFTVGEPREVLGLIGLVIALGMSLWRKKRISGEYGYQNVFLAGWIIAIMMIAIFPHALKLDVPSGRIGNYGVYPLALLASYAFFSFFEMAKSGDRDQHSLIDPRIFLSLIMLLLIFVVSFGFYDNAQNSVRGVNAQKIVQTLAASDYLSEKIESGDQILKDHIYLAADSWVKLFFMRDYNFPLYRANLDRYSNGIDKQEQCTLLMISTPSIAESRKCFNDLSMDFVLVNQIDTPQFNQDDSFWKVYDNGEAVTYYYRPL
jgi:hypothetical protein